MSFDLGPSNQDTLAPDGQETQRAPFSITYFDAPVRVAEVKEELCEIAQAFKQEADLIGFSFDVMDDLENATRLVVARLGDNVVGFIALRGPGDGGPNLETHPRWSQIFKDGSFPSSQDSSWLDLAYVDQQHRQQGIFKSMVAAVPGDIYWTGSSFLNGEEKPAYVAAKSLPGVIELGNNKEQAAQNGYSNYLVLFLRRENDAS